MNGSDLKAWRRECGYTQEALAVELEVARQTVIGWEKSDQPLPRMLILALQAIAAVQKVAGQRMTKNDQKWQRSRADEPGAKVARDG